MNRVEISLNGRDCSLVLQYKVNLFYVSALYEVD